MFELKKVSCKAGEHTLLLNVSLQFKTGKINAVIGANGAGKSSLMKCLLGDLAINTGTVSFADNDLRSYPLTQLSKMRAYIAQTSASIFSLSVFDYLILARVQYTESKKYAENLVFEAVKQFSIVEFALKDITQLSGGERQTVEFVRAYLQLYDTHNMEHKCMLLDEPASALDIKQTQLLYQHIQAFRALGGTVIIIDHDINAVANLCDHLVLMRNGSIFAEGEPQTVFSTQNLNHCFDVKGELLQKASRNDLATFHLSTSTNAQNTINI